MKYKKIEILQQIVTIIVIFLRCFMGCKWNNNSNNLYNKIIMIIMIIMIIIINKWKCSNN
jgi:hypothetical protein